MRLFSSDLCFLLLLSSVYLRRYHSLVSTRLAASRPILTIAPLSRQSETLRELSAFPTLLMRGD